LRRGPLTGPHPSHPRARGLEGWGDLSPQAGRGEDIRFDLDGFEHAVRLWTVVLEISVLMAHFPSREIAQRSYEYRTLGLG
jgi:ribonucleoside-diphosphate reductase alpha chain